MDDDPPVSSGVEGTEQDFTPPPAEGTRLAQEESDPTPPSHPSPNDLAARFHDGISGVVGEGEIPKDAAPKTRLSLYSLPEGDGAESRKSITDRTQRIATTVAAIMNPPRDPGVPPLQVFTGYEYDEDENEGQEGKADALRIVAPKPIDWEAALEGTEGIQDALDVVCVPHAERDLRQYQRDVLARVAQQSDEPGVAHVYLAPDGSVKGRTELLTMTNAGKAARLCVVNHHDYELDAPGTPCTASQLLELFEQGRIVDPDDAWMTHVFHVDENDGDADIVLTRWITKNWRMLLADKEKYERFRKLLDLENNMDVNGGYYPINKDDKEQMKLLRQMQWIFKPYNQTVSPAGGKAFRDFNGQEMMDVVRRCMENVDAYMAGEAQEDEAINMSYKTLQEGNGWIMIDQEKSPLSSRYELCKHYRVVINVTGIEKDKRWMYSIGTVLNQVLSPEKEPLQLDLPALFVRLNALEEEKRAAAGQQKQENGQESNQAVPVWGGRANIGGSPRGIGSRISPDELVAEMEKFLTVPDPTEPEPPEPPQPPDPSGPAPDTDEPENAGEDLVTAAEYVEEDEHAAA